MIRWGGAVEDVVGGDIEHPGVCAFCKLCKVRCGVDIEGLCGFWIALADVRSAFGGGMENDVGVVPGHKLGDGRLVQQV